jgi:hypothetical protein
MLKKYSFFLLSFFLSAQTKGQSNYPTLSEGTYAVDNYVFENREKLALLNLHYYTIGTPRKGKDGKVMNAVLIMHGTTAIRRPLRHLWYGNWHHPRYMILPTLNTAPYKTSRVLNKQLVWGLRRTVTRLALPAATLLSMLSRRQWLRKQKSLCNIFSGLRMKWSYQRPGESSLLIL